MAYKWGVLATNQLQVTGMIDVTNVLVVTVTILPVRGGG